MSAIYFFRRFSCWPYCQGVHNSVTVHKARVDCMLIHVPSDKFYNELTAPYVVIVQCTCIYMLGKQ